MLPESQLIYRDDRFHVSGCLVTRRTEKLQIFYLSFRFPSTPKHLDTFISTSWITVQTYLLFLLQLFNYTLHRKRTNNFLVSFHINTLYLFIYHYGQNHSLHITHNQLFLTHVAGQLDRYPVLFNSASQHSRFVSCHYHKFYIIYISIKNRGTCCDEKYSLTDFVFHPSTNYQSRSLVIPFSVHIVWKLQIWFYFIFSHLH